MKMLCITAPVVLVFYALIEELGLPNFVIAVVIFICWLIVNRPMFLMPDDNKYRSDIEVTTSTNEITVLNPKTHYKFTKLYSDIAEAKSYNYFGMPIIKLIFQGNEVIHFVGLESSDRLFDIVSKRLK
ncbi:hypothetical protein [Shewanella salipaludis]|uniref:Uncharacterized protein n=1 Tax=Shewanella salipaludis TaxID=2723052 RepID=A0A972JJU1_9GAMM|nr:hypothetical protein [Shewanella salipaludis]NMH65510.1 hypothetical protein [Shewanella salipaludis]